MNKWPWLRIGKDPTARGKALTFLLCLVFSFIAWLSIKLSQETIASVPLELSITNIPESIIFSNPVDTSFTLSIETTGIRILSNRTLRRTNRLETDFNLLQRARGESPYVLFLTGNQIEARVAAFGDLPRSAVHVHPDTIFFTTSEAFSKRVPIELNKTIDYRPGFRLYGQPEIMPDSVIVTGPIHLKDSIFSISTVPLVKRQVDSPVKERLALINPWRKRQVFLSETGVDLVLPVEEFTEANVELPVTLNCPEINLYEERGRLFMFPDRINVSYLVALRDVNLIVPEMFTVTVPCPDTVATLRPRLQITIADKPSNVEIIRIRPQEIEYLWIKD